MPGARVDPSQMSRGDARYGRHLLVAFPGGIRIDLDKLVAQGVEPRLSQVMVCTVEAIMAFVEQAPLSW